MSELPTPQQLASFSRMFDKVTRKHPYVTAFSDMGWDERVSTMEKVIQCERERELLASDARRYGARRGFAPELSIRADALVNKMEDLVPDSTGGHNNNWSKIDFLRMDGMDLRWHKWYKSIESVERTARIMLLNTYELEPDDEAPLEYHDVAADVVAKLAHGKQFMEAFKQEETVKIRSRHALLSDEEYNTYRTECLSMVKHLKGYLTAIRVWKVSKPGHMLKAEDLEYWSSEEVLERFLEVCDKESKLLLGYAIYFKHLITVNPDFLNSRGFEVHIYAPLPNKGRAVAANKYFRPHANNRHREMLQVGRVAAPATPNPYDEILYKGFMK